LVDGLVDWHSRVCCLPPLIVFGMQARRLRQTIVTMKKLGENQSVDMQASIAVAKDSAEAAIGIELPIVKPKTRYRPNQRRILMRRSGLLSLPLLLSLQPLAAAPYLAIAAQAPDLDGIAYEQRLGNQLGKAVGPCARLLPLS
jgi:hypothetical protein